MERTYLALIPLLAASSALNIVAATPQVYNNYSFIPPGAPNHVVAQGSIIAIKNSIGPAEFSPLQATPVAGYGGVTINVTVNGTTTQVLNYYVGPQLAGVLPSNTPTGLGSYTVTYNGLTTAPAPIMVVQNSFGILAMDSSGQGLAKVCDYNFDKTCLTYVSLEHSAKPGDVITIWGSGLGPTQNDAISVDLTKTVPVEVWIGGQQATVTYAARSQFVGLDLINTSIPANVSGCYVSVVVKIGNNVSNTTYLPVEQSGNACSDPLTGFSGTSLAALFSKESFNSGAVSLTHMTNAQGTTTETAGAAFSHVTTSSLASLQQFFPFASPGSCTVWTINVDQNQVPIGIVLPTPLDAGTITVKSNGSTKTLTKGTSGSYSADLGSGGFLTGTVTANGGGGADVGSFTANTTANSGFTWTNSAAISTVVRANGQEIDWSGEAANSFVTMTGTSINIDLTTLTGAVTTFTCLEDASKGKFTIPSWVLLAIPASPTSTPIPIPGTLTVSNSTAPVLFTATGLDTGLLEFLTSSSKNVTYQ
jgi:uncharacterized protein (TIGR03437 family)